MGNQTDPGIDLNRTRRIKLPGEIKPMLIEYEDDRRKYVKGMKDLYKDFDRNSADSITDYSMKLYRSDYNSARNIKLSFKKVYCIDLVIEYHRVGSIGLIWKCSQSNCSCAGKVCPLFNVSVVTAVEGESNETLPDARNCKPGNTVIVQSNWIQLYGAEFAVHGSIICPAGTFENRNGSCEPCPENMYSSAGALSCTRCPPDSSSNKNRNICESETPNDSQTFKLVLSSLCGIFLMISISLTITLTRKWLKKCFTKSCKTSEVESDHEYVNNNFPLPTLPLSPAPPPPVRISSPSSLVSDQSHSQEDNSVAEAETADADYVNGMEMSDGYLNGNQ